VPFGGWGGGIRNGTPVCTLETDWGPLGAGCVSPERRRYMGLRQALRAFGNDGGINISVRFEQSEGDSMVVSGMKRESKRRTLLGGTEGTIRERLG